MRVGGVIPGGLGLDPILEDFMQKPLFVVRRLRDSESNDKGPSFQLKPTWTYWIWVSLGSTITFSPLLLSQPLVGSVIAYLAIIWLALLSGEFCLQQWHARRLQRSAYWHDISPYRKRSIRLVGWFICAISLGIVVLIAGPLATSESMSTTGITGDFTFMATFMAVVLVALGAILGIRSRRRTDELWETLDTARAVRVSALGLVFLVVSLFSVCIPCSSNPSGAREAPSELMAWMVSVFNRAAAVAPTEVTSQVITVAILVCGLMATFALFIRFLPRFELAELTDWYLKLPAPLRKRALEATGGHHTSINRFTRSLGRLGFTVWPVAYPTSTWRQLTDSSRELHLAGMAAAFFSRRHSNSIIWAGTFSCYLWYFSAITIPLLTLFLAPPMLNIFFGYDELPKARLALSAVAWAGWAISFFLYFAERDFVAPARAMAEHPSRLPLSAQHPNILFQHAAHGFFTGKGIAVFNLVVLAILPFYFDYISAFSE